MVTELCDAKRKAYPRMHITIIFFLVVVVYTAVMLYEGCYVLIRINNKYWIVK